MYTILSYMQPYSLYGDLPRVWKAMPYKVTKIQTRRRPNQTLQAVHLCGRMVRHSGSHNPLPILPPGIAVIQQSLGDHVTMMDTAELSLCNPIISNIVSPHHLIVSSTTVYNRDKQQLICEHQLKWLVPNYPL